jgi:hypothetical protein
VFCYCYVFFVIRELGAIRSLMKDDADATLAGCGGAAIGQPPPSAMDIRFRPRSHLIGGIERAESMLADQWLGELEHAIHRAALPQEAWFKRGYYSL